MIATVTPLAEGMRAQHEAIVLTEPEIMGVQTAEPGGWRFLYRRCHLGLGGRFGAPQRYGTQQQRCKRLQWV